MIRFGRRSSWHGVPSTDTNTFINAYGTGNCLVYLYEAVKLLGI